MIEQDLDENESGGRISAGANRDIGQPPTPSIGVLYRVSCTAPLMIMPLRWSPAKPISNSVKPLAIRNRTIAPVA